MPTLGILGGGQLGRMLALAAHSLGIDVLIFAERADEPGPRVAPSVLGRFDDVDALTRFAARCDVVTYEFENIPLVAIDAVAAVAPLRPGRRSIEIASDRAEEKGLFRTLGIRTTHVATIDVASDVAVADHLIGRPAVMKTRRMGYDGKGQRVLRDSTFDAAEAFAALGAPSILESFVPFARELSVIGARALDGTIAVYPPFENRHADGILRESSAPAIVDAAVAREAEQAIRFILNALDHVGVLALELFEIRNSEYPLVANEIAPRVHNTGHLTIEGSETSQFEQHVRAVMGLPLGSTAPRGRATMWNLVGEHPPLSTLAALPGAHVHLYSKTPRAGRKLGHVTLVDPLDDASASRAAAIRAALTS